IKAARIPYRVPEEADLRERLRPVLSVLYLIYNTGLQGPERASLRSEAIRLARALVELVSDEPEAAGLLALMLLSESRAPARADGDDLVFLRDQDRTRWNRRMMAEAQALAPSSAANDRAPSCSTTQSKRRTAPPTRSRQRTGPGSSRSTITCTRSCP